MLSDFYLQSKDIWHVGDGLQRPETVEVGGDGSLWACDARGFARICPDGAQIIIGQPNDTSYVQQQDVNIRMSDGVLPTGFALAEQGDIIFAAYGDRKICRMRPDGRISTFLDSVDGVELARPNAVVRDKKGRYWITVSTRDFRWAENVAAHPEQVSSGFVVLLDGSRARIVADGLRFANACRLDADERYFYVAESFGACLTRFRVMEDGTLTGREQYGPTFEGNIDGFAFDRDDNVWVTQPMLERLLVLTARGDVLRVADFGNPSALAQFGRAVEAGMFDFNLAARCASPELGGPTSIAFGGDDLKTVYVGAVFGNRIASFQSPVAGTPPIYG
ncbi:MULTISPECIES: SMP-30/gluconolactonase/LRE family protein [unclassified Sphingomonas]|uniref:SMP-30/gluconolactonase/LRE family protein n=1 Tax=unclassified Sphingomonas TaxID=196159 RepID=UPI000AF18649|nr:MULTISPECIES: SMP-30/gluconolactonase/LRE family protein [unclassified Sphingomonas]